MNEINNINIDQFVQAYRATALELADDPATANAPWSQEARFVTYCDCISFLHRASPYLRLEQVQDKASAAGQDFYLTRNGHGSGFWEGDWERGEILSDIAKAYAEQSLYVGDDGFIYCQ